MQRISQPSASKEQSTQLTDFPYDLLAKIISFLPIDAISKLSRTNKTFFALAHDKEMYKWLKTSIDDKLHFFSPEKKLLATSLGRLFREISLANLNEAIDRENNVERSWIGLLFIIASIFFVLGTAISLSLILTTDIAFGKALVLGMGAPTLLLLLVGAIKFIPQIKQYLYQRQADAIIAHIEDDPILVPMAPLFTAMQTIPYKRLAMTTSTIKEVAIDMETQEELTNDIEAKAATHQPLLAKKGSPTLFAEKVESPNVDNSEEKAERVQIDL